MFTDTLALNGMGLVLQETNYEVPITTLTRQYLFDMENVEERSENTIKSRRSHLKHFSDYFANEEITEITDEDIKSYFIHLRGSTSSLTRKKLSDGDMNNRKRALRVFFRWCKEEKEIPIRVNPKKIHTKKQSDTPTKLLALEDIEHVIEHVPHEQDRLIIRIIAEAGLRISEVAKLKIEHIRGRRIEVIGKGGKRRITFISDELSRTLKLWMLEKGWGNGFVFRPIMHGKRGEGYKHLHTIRVRIQFWFRKLLGIQMHPHQLRHAFARHLLEGGCSLRAIQKMLGHSNIETTMIYLGVDDDWLEKEYEQSVHHNNSMLMLNTIDN